MKMMNYLTLTIFILQSVFAYLPANALQKSGRPVQSLLPHTRIVNIETGDGTNQGSDHVDQDEQSKKKLEPVCNACLDKDVKAGDYYEAGGHIWRLSYFWQERGMWVADYVGITKSNEKELGASVDTNSRYNPDVEIQDGKVKYKGKTVDETFGRNENTNGNSQAIRWMNARISDLDEAVGNGKINSGDEDDVREMLFSAVGNEAVAALGSFDDVFYESMSQINGETCNESSCHSSHSDYFTEMLEKFKNAESAAQSSSNELSSITHPIGESNDEQYISNHVYGTDQNYENFRSELRPQLLKTYSRLAYSPTSSVVAAYSKQKAFQYLQASDQYALNGDIESAKSAQNIAEFLTDIGTDILPWTSVPKDLFKAVSGFDPLSGADLSVNERLLAAGFAAAAIFTAGGSNALKLVLKDAVQLIKQSAKDTLITVNTLKGLNRFRKVEKSVSMEIAKNVFNETGIKVHEVFSGLPGRSVTVIGQDMNRVHAVAESLEKQGIKTRVFEWSNVADAEWKSLVKDHGWLGKEKARGTIAFRENKEWIETGLNLRSPIISAEQIAHDSVFFDMEKETIAKKLINDIVKERL